MRIFRSQRELRQVSTQQTSVSPRSPSNNLGRFALATVLGLALYSTFTPFPPPAGWQEPLPSPTSVTPTRARVQANFSKLPLYFIENRGQVDEQVAYYVHGRDMLVYFTADGVTFVLSSERQDHTGMKPQPVATQECRGTAPPRFSLGALATQQRWVLKLDFVGANPHVRPQGQDLTPAVISYFKGAPDRWQTGLPTYSRIVYPDLWPGIDLIYSGSDSHLKYTFLVHPGADPRQIKLAYRGAQSVTLTEAGTLQITTPLTTLTDAPPSVYQELNGTQHEVSSVYTIEQQADSYEYGFQVGPYDPGRPLFIDPAVLVYAGFIGGSGGDRGLGIAVDNAGNAYITGDTLSTEATFPERVGPDLTHNGGIDAFVAKIRADGTGLVYVGYIGGSGDDIGYGIAVDSAGNAYITGNTTSTAPLSSTDIYGFPVVGGPDLTLNSYYDPDAFVAKVRADGTGLVYAGYIGGSGNDVGSSIAVDSTGHAYIAGHTTSDEDSFPVTVGPDLTYNDTENFNAFVAKVRADGTGLVYAGYIGGSGDDNGFGIAVDSTGHAYITGRTTSKENTFPEVGGPDVTYHGGFDAFVAKVRADGTGLVYAGYIGGSENDAGLDIAVDSTGHAYIVGETFSSHTTFPVIGGPSLIYGGGRQSDAFVAKVRADGTGLVYAGYIGAGGEDFGSDIAVDRAGSAYVTGYTNSGTAFPVVSEPGETFNGVQDAFVAKIVTPLPVPFLGTFRPSGPPLNQGLWFFDLIRGGPNELRITYGTNTDIPLPGDYDGNERADLAVFRPSQGRWFLDTTLNGGTDRAVSYGTRGDVPVPGDYNGDGITDLAVFRRSQGRWFIDTTRNGTTNFSVRFGIGTDIPLRPNGWILTTLSLLPQ